MKKLTSIYVFFVSFFGLAFPALAAVQIEPISGCAAETGQHFNLLCNLGADGIGPLINSLITIAFIVAVLLALAFLIFGGIKWILSGGDKTKVEEARNHIVAALVGLVIVFLSYFILRTLSSFFNLDLFSGPFQVPTLGK